MSACLQRRWIIGITASALLTVLPAAKAEAAEWRWSLAPYLWASDTVVDVKVNDRELVETEEEFSDLIEELDFAGQIRLEGQKGRIGLFVDLTYLDFTDDPQSFRLPVVGTVTAKGDLELTLLEVGGIWNPAGTGEGVSLLYGARITDIDQEIDVRTSLPSLPERRYEITDTMVDGLVGLRYISRWGEAWSFHFRGDVSTGATEVTWSGVLGFGYTFGAADQYTLLAGYRYQRIELDEEDARADLEVTNILGGPIVGLLYKL